MQFCWSAALDVYKRQDADLIIVLENGEISGIGTSEELLKTNAIYREVYESQVKGGEDHE